MKILKNTFSWSISRHRAFHECRRAYYFRHYGFWGGWEADADPRTRELYVLKHLSNRFAFAGQVVHQTVADVLNRHRYGPEIGLETAKENALALLRKGFRQSLAGEHRIDPKRKTGLFEHEYEEPVGDEEWRRMRDRVFRCLENFFASKIRTIILDTRIENWLPIDTLDSFEFEGETVFVAPDFALRNPQGNALVIDWKTGWPGKGEDRMQIVCYGLFAREKWGVDPSRAIGELHYLQSGDVEIITLNETVLEEGTTLIRDSMAEMKACLDDPGDNRADPDRFPRTDDRAVCARCSFRRVCWPEWPSTSES